MRLRTVALAVALACGLTATVEARPKPASHFRKAKRSKHKPHKYKAPKSKGRRARH